MSPRITVLAGDGIGPEVIGPALEVLPSDWEIQPIAASADRYLRSGELLTDDELAAIRNSDALLFGAIGDPRVEPGILERGILLRLRQQLDLYINLRPFPELRVVIVRENTEGLYAGRGERRDSLAVEISVNTRSAIERCTRYAFELAEARSGRLTLVHKTNVLEHAGGLWQEVVNELGSDHPDVVVDYDHADAAAYHLIVEPARFDVILTDNLFGDLLADVAAGVAGGIGKAASANLHPDASTRPHGCMGLFEPVHGSAPDLAGRGLADPTASIEAARMMVEQLERESLHTAGSWQTHSTSLPSGSLT